MSEKLIDSLRRSVLSPDQLALDGALADIRHSGVSEAEIVDIYIPEAARRLGDDWLDDAIGFTEVTIGCSRLQRALRGLSGRRRDTGQNGPSHHAILLAVVPGEDHSLGALVVAEQLRSMNISVKLLMGVDRRSIVKAVAEGRHDAVFLSLGTVEQLARTRRLVEDIRSAAGRRIPVVVGGAVARLGQDLSQVTGADFAAKDVAEALGHIGIPAIPLVA